MGSYCPRSAMSSLGPSRVPPRAWHRPLGRPLCCWEPLLPKDYKRNFLKSFIPPLKSPEMEPEPPSVPGTWPQVSSSERLLTGEVALHTQQTHPLWAGNPPPCCFSKQKPSWLSTANKHPFMNILLGSYSALLGSKDIRKREKKRSLSLREPTCWSHPLCACLSSAFWAHRWFRQHEQHPELCAHSRSDFFCSIYTVSCKTELQTVASHDGFRTHHNWEMVLPI